MAGTGSGKTRAAPIIHAATAKACGEDLRLSVTSGLRTLTLQAGTEYVRELGFSRDDVEVIIGDDLLRRMHDAGVRRNVTEDVGTDGQIGDDLLLADGSNTAHALALPSTALKSLGGKADGSLARMVASPVLVSTIDTLMSAADARRGRHTAAMMRVATSDLLIDEIDDFADEDIVAISRLVYLSASFGRKVVIASATVTPTIADALFRCYLAGWQNHRHVSSAGSEAPVVAGWFGERAGVSACSKMDSLEEFRGSHEDFVNKMIESLKDSDGQRSLGVARMRDCETAAEYFEQVTDIFEVAHDKNHVLDEKTGKRLSLGLVRWSNVGTSVFHARTVMERVFPAHVAVKVVPYNGSMLNIHRNYVERTLNPALKRKPVEGRDPILSNPYVRQALDESSSSVTDVIIVVISTSIEEVGRDHDFDWAICEPSSLRSLIQIAGRIRRHRLEQWLSKNLFLLDRCFKERGGIAIGSGSFSYPGPETLSHVKTENRQDLVLKERTIDRVFDVESLSNVVDSTEVIGMDQPKSGIGRLERLVSEHYLTQGADRGVSVGAFISDPLSLACDFHPSQRKFRRQRCVEVTYVLWGDRQDRSWYRTPFDKGDARELISCGKKVDRLFLENEARLLVSMPDDDILIDQAAVELGVESLKQWEEDSFLSISKTDFRDSLMKKEYLYHRSFGFIAKEDWMAEFDD
ncbi:hypothetical protein [Roseibium sp. RKSG952]|uniref:hypothetical protein n=1 Tax=Roseibium sp. RKSG952 TaxID=2529384 RepID=UPI0012BCFD03|nr:hypothetical protein [Roseibium sp. RKSG952]MTH95504.1 hypothetical protein [Roseibium sp. RKSG952]